MNQPPGVIIQAISDVPFHCGARCLCRYLMVGSNRMISPYASPLPGGNKEGLCNISVGFHASAPALTFAPQVTVLTLFPRVTR